jgi:hypothetical protein
MSSARRSFKVSCLEAVEEKRIEVRATSGERD